MLSALLACVVVSNSPVEPKIDQLKWMAGDWTCEIWGGTFDESWSTPKGGAMQGMGRHISDGKTSFMEFMSIEQVEDKGLVMFIHTGALSKGAKKPAEFTLMSVTEKEAIFERELEGNFPKKITYTVKGDDSIECVLTGEEDGEQQKAVFDFVRKSG